MISEVLHGSLRFGLAFVMQPETKSETKSFSQFPYCHNESYYHISDAGTDDKLRCKQAMFDDIASQELGRAYVMTFEKFQNARTVNCSEENSCERWLHKLKCPRFIYVHRPDPHLPRPPVLHLICARRTMPPSGTSALFNAPMVPTQSNESGCGPQLFLASQGARAGTRTLRRTAPLP